MPDIRYRINDKEEQKDKYTRENAFLRNFDWMESFYKILYSYIKNGEQFEIDLTWINKKSDW